MAYSIIVGGIEGRIDDILQRIKQVDRLLDELVDADILPILGRHYDQSGIHTHGGALKRALTQRGAQGNQITKMAGRLQVGIDYNALPEARWVIEGRNAVTAKPGHALRFFDEAGKPVFAKHVKAVPAHPLFFLTPDELAQVEADLQAKIMNTK